MEVIYSKQFIKDVKALPEPIKKQISKVVLSFYNASSIRDISSVKKIRDSQNAYRIRVGDYRIGCFVNNNQIGLARIAHRKDIYRFFP